ncbi:MAG: hypothetical protein KME52_30230 [Desmonostoc geniculatum HA4340-LM1]|nr:hypothetical protein [Desmonostoc geniculatum HA4340-LM1]
MKEVGLLDELSARKLITQPVQGNLEYDEHAITEILKLSSGHPCLIQFICFNLFIYVRLQRRLTVTREDVEQILDNAIETAEGGIAWFYDGLSPEEKVLFSAVSDAQEIAIKQNKSSPENTFTHLENYGVIKTEELTQAAKKLVDKGYLDENKQRVKIELIRRWIVQYYPLNREILKLEEIKKEEINQISEKAKALYKQGKIQEEIDHYENILQLHPNHFSTIPILAESYLEIKNFDKALTLYKRAYQADPNRNKEGFLLVGEKYGEYLIKKGELSPAKIQLEAVLKIDHNRKSAKDKLREIEAIIEQQKLEMKPEDDKQKLKIYPFILLIILIIIAIVSGIIGIIIYQSLTSCPQGQQKLNDECVTTVPDLPVRNDPIQSNISSGAEEIYSNSLREEFEKNFKGQIISKIDLRDPILNIEQELKNKDNLSQNLQAVILLPNVDHTATALDIAKVNINHKLGLKLLGGDALYNQKTLDEGGNGVEDLVLAVPWFREAPQAKVFSQTAYKLWEKDISWRTATSYDAAQAFMNSLSAQPSRETILQKLPQTNLSAKLTSGNNLKFQNGERQNEAILVNVESGKFKYLEQCSP